DFHSMLKSKMVFKNEEKALYTWCSIFDIPFYSGVFEGGKNSKWHMVSSYMKQINSFRDVNNYGSCFLDGEIKSEDMKKQKRKIVKDAEIDDKAILFWGDGFEDYDYLYLENELKQWQKTHKHDNYAEITLLREICLTSLEIRKKRERKESVKNETKALQDLMKTASIDPAKANAADNGKSLDSYGTWLKEIEESEPAEFFEDKKLFKDYDKIKEYTDKYIFRPLKNLLTGSRDFNIEDGDD
ncbi:MAG: hypothetical protein ACOCUI_02065, partial [bacterium]